MISVIIPVYNVEEYLDTCLTSVLAQTYSDLEILLINDGSTDCSGSICDKYGQLDSRVKVFHKENGGVSSARNLGIEKAKGDYIAFVDPDDWLELNAYEVVMQQFDLIDIDAVFFGYWENYLISSNMTAILHSPEKQGTVNGRDALYQCLIGMGVGYFTSVWNKVFKTQLIRNNQVYFEKFLIGEDEVWLAKLLPKAQKVSLVNLPLYHWLQRENSALHNKKNYAKWDSALQSKLAVIEAVSFDNQLLVLSKAKVYNDIFDVVWKAYIMGDYLVAKDFVKKLEPYKKDFYKSKDFSFQKHIKFRVLKLFIYLHFPTCFVEQLGYTTMYRIKEKINGI